MVKRSRPAAALAASLALVVVGLAPACGSQAPDSGQAVVWAVGDGGDGGPSARSLAASIAQAGPDRFLYLGDVYPHGSASDFARNYAPVYGHLDEITEPTVGNHDWGTRRTGYLPYWREARGRQQPYWYSFRLGGWELISLNSEAAHGAGSDQLRWLGRRLRKPGTCRLAYWHRPRFSAGPAHGDAPDLAPLWKSLRGRARVVVNGHEHNLQRFRRRDGLTQYVAGAGGSPGSSLPRDGRLAFGRAAVTGALRIALRPGSAELEFRTAEGRVLDRSRVTCRRR